MSNFWSLVLTLAIISGQLIRFTLRANYNNGGGVSLLDFTIFIFCIIGLLFQLKSRSFLKPPKFIIAACSFILISIISLFLSPLHLKASEYEVSSYYILRFSAYILLTWLIFSNTFKNLRKQIDIILIVSGVGIAFLGLLQFIFLPDLLFLSKWGWDPHYYRNISTFLDPNFTGAFLVLTLLSLIRAFDQKITLLTPKIISICFFLTYFSLLLTFSRSSYLMFLSAGLSLSYFKRSKDILIKTSILFFILIAGFQIYIQNVSSPKNIDRKQSASLRFNTWQQGLVLFQKFPYLGVGFNSYRYALKEFNLGDEEFLSTHGASSNDSSLLFVAATTGIVGLISYLTFLFFILKRGWDKNVFLISAVSGLLVHSFFSNSLFYPPILLWILITSADPKK